MRQIVLDGEIVNDDSDCYVIAEIGHNHQGSLETCMEMFKVAKDCGANAVKLQKRDNKGLFTKELYDQVYDNPNSYGGTYGEHREALEFGLSEFRELKSYAKELGITLFSTAFDFKSADFLEELDMPYYKIASADLKNVPMLRHLAKFKKPLILSTGGGSLDDVKRAYYEIMAINPQLSILQCTASYPCDYSLLNLKVISTFREQFPSCVIGLSDHDNGIAMSVAAYVLGMRVIEKHFTLNRANKGTDHAFSLEPIGLRKMVRDLRRAKVALGDGIKHTYQEEVKPITKMAKKIVAARDLPAGHRLTNEDLTFKSPGDGMAPYEIDHVLGKSLVKPMKTDEALVISNVQ
jgi:N-acetylneuraminate synthase/sialic acid synthase